MARRDKELFQFSWLELTALALSFSVTMVIVFLLGFYVGRQNAAHHAGLPERVGRIPVERPETYVPGRVGTAGSAPAEPERAPRPELPATAPKKAPPAPSKPEKVEPKKPEPPKVAEKQPEKEPDIDFKPAYSVQVLATRRSADADKMATDLRAKGFDAYVRKVEDAEGAWYRVRVGRFRDLPEARAMADKCRKTLGLNQAYVSTY